MLRRGYAAGVAGLALMIGVTGLERPVQAQQLALEEIVVTARKREEKLSEIPLSISAFSSADIERKGFKGLEDIALAAPGVQYSNQGGQIPGRYTSAIRFRGMNVNSDSPSLQLGSLFIDGVYVLGGTQSIPLDDLERIEVIKGPQSAYFGRNTFGGAINYITKNPSLTEYKGKVNVSAATYSEFDVSASHEGPIVEDKLGYRVGGRFYSKGAMWRASDGGALGTESSKSVNATLYATPSDSFKVKVRAFYDKDDDGPAAGGLISGIRNDTCTGKTIATQDPATPNARPVNYVCGAVPTQGKAISALGNTQIIDSNTSLAPGRAALLGNPTVLQTFLVNRANPTQVDVPFIDHVGLVRDVFRFSAAADYDFAGGYVATVQGGYNRLRANWIRDFGLTAIENWYSRDPQDSTDYSFEGRVASPTDQRLSWLVGANYYHQKFIQSGSGGDAVSLCLPFVNPPLPYQFTTAGNYTGCPNSIFTTANSLLQNTDLIKAWGIFASVNYKITDQITATFEGRYQYNDASTAILTAAPLKVIDKNFLPRAILKYQPTRDTNLYASYAKGVIQGQPNAQVATATPNELRQYQAVIPGIGSALPAEILNMWEGGLKQSLWDNRANVNLAGYYGTWKGAKGRGVVLVQEDCGSPSHGFSGGCTTGSAPLGLGTPGTPARNLDGSPFFNSRNVNAPGDLKLWGFEFEGSAVVSEGWNAHLNVTYAKSKYTNFLFNFVQPIAGFSQMKGNNNARFPIWSGAFSSDYTHQLNSTWEWFVNGDVIYVGKTYADESNLAFCKPYWTVNTRAGISKPGLRVELFVKNLLNDDSWTACARWTDFDQNISLGQLTVRQGIAVTQNNKRQFGIRSSIEF
jgi:iron complex outermembrane receptor protein